MKNLQVYIDAIPLLLRSAGVKTYVYYWTQALRVLAGPEAVHLFPFLDKIGDCVHERSVIGAGGTIARLALLHAANLSPLPVLNALGARVDVFHASHQLLRPPRNTRITATLYDLTCWLVPELHSAANVSMAKRFADRVLRRASGTIAISENTRDDAVRVLGLDQNRITVIYPGVAPAFFTAEPARRAKPYVLFVGTIEPRKNVAALLDAWKLLPPGTRQEYDLVVAGSPGWGDPNVLARLRSGLDGVSYLGYVREDELPALTRGASVFVYPSLYEGFGLPVAQAMAGGIPVVSSNGSCLPEVAGDGGILVDPRQPGELAEALAAVLGSESRRQELGANGARRAQRYRWEVCAEQSWQFFERIEGSG
jgi:alpha-1,3-rhamnosyl/mannosyltransferase